MGTDRRKGIYQCASFLDHQTLHCIRIVGTPDLRAVIKHSRIKTCAAAGAVLKKKIRKLRNQSLLKLINTKHISVEKLLLSFFGKIAAAKVRKLTVHIPFHIGNVCTSKNRCHTFVGIISYFRSGKIQNILVSALGCLTALDLDRPVRMCTVKVRIR